MKFGHYGHDHIWERDHHGSLYDRGRADYYYGRGPSPHYWVDSAGRRAVPVTEQKAVDEYMAGYNDPTNERKDYR